MRLQLFEKTRDDKQKKTEKVTDAEIRCPLCGKSFHAREAKQCMSCKLGQKCGLVMCPNCSYEFAP